MRDERERMRMVMKVLIAIVVVLGLIVIYLLIAQPAYNNSLNQAGLSGFDQGINYTINSIIQSVQLRGYAAINLGNNQTITLIPPSLCANLTAAPAAPSTSNRTA